MSDLHEVVIHHIRKVVGRVAVSLDDDEVALVLILLVVAVDNIRERRTAFAEESDDVALAAAGTASGLVRRDAAACAGIVDEVAAVEGLLLVPLEVLRGAKATVSLAALDELVGMFSVVVQSLGLLRGQSH